MFKKLIKTIFHYDWEVVEIQGASFKMVMGIWLLLPFKTFGSSGYSGVASVMSENMWGVCIFLLGAIHLAAIVSQNVKFRRNMIFIAFMFWVFLVVVFYISRPGNLIIAIMLVESFFLAINYLRLSIPGLFNKYKVE